MNKETKRSIQISSELYDEIKEFCNLNELKLNKFIQELLKGAFMKEKYGESPFTKWVESPVPEELPYNDIEEKNNEYIEQIAETIALPIKEEITSSVSAISQNVIEQTPESQAIIDEHMRQLNKPKRRRLK